MIQKIKCFFLSHTLILKFPSAKITIEKGQAYMNKGEKCSRCGWVAPKSQRMFS